MRSSSVLSVVVGSLFLFVAGTPAHSQKPIELRLNTPVATPEGRVVATAFFPLGCPSFTYFFRLFREPGAEGSRMLLEESDFYSCLFGGIPSFPPQSMELPLLPVGDYTFEALVAGGEETIDSASFQIREPTELLLRDLRFKVEVVWDDVRAGTGQGKAVPLTDESGGFWFFGKENLEVTVKVLDGRAVNGHFWVFLASMTDVGFTLKVTRLDDPCLFLDPPPGPGCEVRTYVQDPGKNRNTLDVEAFRSAI